jgi:hypothetical protein
LTRTDVASIRFTKLGVGIVAAATAATSSRVHATRDCIGYPFLPKKPSTWFSDAVTAGAALLSPWTFPSGTCEDDGNNMRNAFYLSAGYPI